MSRVLSGVKPSGKMTLGNYIGSFRNFSSFQDENETYIFVADVHALTKPIDANVLRSTTYDILSFYLASGLDPEKCVIFKQSDILEVAMLNAILVNYIYMGELSRMIQYKEHVQKNNGKEIGCGIFTYPVLMAADLFMYDTEICPVGEDQRQHVELAHDIARRFNSRYKEEVLKLPRSVTPKTGKRIMNLQDPSKKMSKSDKDDEQKGIIYLQDDEKVIRKKIMSAVTDSETEVRYDPVNKKGVSNLLTIYAAMKNIDIEEAEKEFIGSNYGNFKRCVADAVINEIGPFKERFEKFRNDEAYLNKVFEDGASKARKVAKEVLERVMKVVGLK